MDLTMIEADLAQAKARAKALDADQDDAHGGRAAAPRQQVNGRGHRSGAEKTGGGQQEDRRLLHKHDHGHDRCRRAAVDAEYARLGERIAHDGERDRAGRRQCRANEEGEQNTR